MLLKYFETTQHKYFTTGKLWGIKGIYLKALISFILSIFILNRKKMIIEIPNYLLLVY